MHDGLAVRFICLEDLAAGRFAVQSVDWYREPFDMQHVAILDFYLAGHVASGSVLSLGNWCESVEKAIAAIADDLGMDLD